MGYKFFDKQFLVMPDDKDIIGKKVFYTNSISCLISIVESGDLSGIGVVNDMLADCYTPFFVDGAYWGLIYYDPNYECKVAYSRGKQIQFSSDYTVDWEDTKEPTWSERLEYRIKPDDIWYVHQDIDGHYWKSDSGMVTVEFKGTEAECDAWITEHTTKTRGYTNRELAKWCADNKGQVRNSNGIVVTEWTYDSAYDDDVVPIIKQVGHHSGTSLLTEIYHH